MTVWMYILGVFWGWPSQIVFCLILSRKKVKPHIVSIFISSLIMSTAMYYIQFTKKLFLITTLQPILFFICLLFIIKLKSFHAILVTLISYAYYTILEQILFMIMSHVKKITLITIIKESVIMPLIIVGAIGWASSYFLSRNRFGFSIFHPLFETHLSINKNERLLLIISIIITCSISVLLFYDIYIITLVTGLLVFCLIGIINFLIKKENY